MDINTQEQPKHKKRMNCLPHITSFCWCIGLEMGTRLIGFLHLGVSLTVMVVCSVMAESARGYRGTVEDADGLYSAWFAVAATVAAFTTLHMLLAGLLLYAAYKRRAGGVRVWVCVMCVAAAAAVLYVVVQSALKGVSGSGSDIFLAFLEAVLVFGFILYSIICVNSYYLMLKSCEDMEGPPKTYY